MHAVRTRVSTLNKAIVDYLCDTFHLAIHLSALRRVYFMAAGAFEVLFLLSDALKSMCRICP